MRWVRLAGTDGDRRPRLALLSADAGSVRPLPSTDTLVELLRSGTLEQAAVRAAGETPIALSAVELLAPLDDPPSVRDFMAFEQHVDGVSRLVHGVPDVPDVWYRQPLFYFSNPASIHGPYDDVAVPPGCTTLDAELELAAVLGCDGRDLSVAQAADTIAGYVVLNDWSARDLQFVEMQGPLGPCKGKDSAITLGPWFVTPDELPSDGADLEMSWWIGDELVGRDRTSSMSWSFAEMISYASRGTTVRAGDIIGSGTCGDGCLAEFWGRHGRDSRPPLRPGDVVRMSVEGLGSTASRVVAATPVAEPLTPRQRQPSDTWDGRPTRDDRR